MSTEPVPYFAFVAAIAMTAWVAYRLGLRHGNETGRAEGFVEGRGLTVSEKSEAWSAGYFAHKRLYDEAKIRPRDERGRFLGKGKIE